MTRRRYDHRMHSTAGNAAFGGFTIHPVILFVALGLLSLVAVGMAGCS